MIFWWNVWYLYSKLHRFRKLSAILDPGHHFFVGTNLLKSPVNYHYFLPIKFADPLGKWQLAEMDTFLMSVNNPYSYYNSHEKKLCVLSISSGWTSFKNESKYSYGEKNTKPRNETSYIPNTINWPKWYQLTIY